MNERIRQLAEQAEDWADNQNFYASDYRDYLMEKFAELIVRECAEVCHKMAEDSDSYVVHDGDTCAEVIKEHFGVEE